MLHSCAPAGNCFFFTTPVNAKQRLSGAGRAPRIQYKLTANDLKPVTTNRWRAESWFLDILLAPEPVHNGLQDTFIKLLMLMAHSILRLEWTKKYRRR